MYCSNCGANIADDAKFCPNCGQSANSAPTNTQANYSNQNQYVPDNGVQETFFRQDGRLNRLRYFKRMLVVGIVSSLLNILIGSTLGTLITLYPQYCLVLRRLHDLGKDNTLALVTIGMGIFTAFIPFMDSESILPLLMILGLIGLVIGLYLLFKKGDEGPNQYGPDPLGKN